MSDAAPNPVALIEHLAKALVNAPDQVFVEEVPEEDEVVIELEVAEDDMGRVIGKAGKIARAMRTLLHAAGVKAGQRYDLEILE
ncbi:MAG: KH domain-containing protein [Acidobacteria bacterium]|nr:KH domain-containing protein [Acidobacteriota bacterium]